VIARGKRILYDVRARRVWPARDEKILAGWNGLMLRALAEGARAFGREDWTALAVRNGEFLLREMVDASGRVQRVHATGERRVPGFLEDHAAIGLAFLALYELTFDRRWLDAARRASEAMVTWFWSDTAGAFYDTASDAETLITRPREPTDNAVPAGTSLAVDLLLRLAELGQDAMARRRANWVLETLAEPMAQHGSAFGHLLGTADMALHGAVEVALVGDPSSPDFHALAAEAGRHYVPALVLAGGAPADAGGVALLADRGTEGGRATAYVCRSYTCERPVTEVTALAEQLSKIRGERTGSKQAS
jgi:uncharacterized protein YyaL (SSP411 family)